MDHPASQFYDAVVDPRYPGRDGDVYSTRWPDWPRGRRKVTRVYHTVQAAVDATPPGGDIHVAPGFYGDVSRETEG